MSILSTSTGLTSILFFNIGRFANSFFICNLWITNCRLYFKLTQKSIHDNFEMKLTHPSNYGLTCFFISICFKCWVLFCEFCKPKSHLFLPSFCFWLNRDSDNRIWEFHRFKNNRMFLITKCITRSSIFKSYRSSNITRINFLYILSVI